MTVGQTKMIALGVGLLLVAGVGAVLFAKRHDKRLAVASALAVAALQGASGGAAGDGSARGIRIPLYENDSKQPTSVMLGRTATPVAGGKYNVTDMRVENYTHSSTGTATNFVIEAPQCLLDPARKVASSPGRIVVSRTDGSFMTTGIGFEFRQLDSVLNITNQVTTLLTREGLDLTKPKLP